MAGEIELKGTLRIKSKTAAAWSAANPVLAADEPARETDTGRLKIGDGANKWNELPYFLDLTNYCTLLDVEAKTALRTTTLTTASLTLSGGGSQFVRTSPTALAVTLTAGTWATRQDAIISVPYNCPVSFSASNVTLRKVAGFDAVAPTSGLKVYTLHAIGNSEIYINVAAYG